MSNKKPIVMPKLDLKKLSMTPEDNTQTQDKFNTVRLPISKNDNLAYTFRHNKERIQSKNADKNKQDEYIFDLESTWSMNTEILQNMLQEICQFSQEKKTKILSHILKIQELVDRKKQLRKNKLSFKSKVLVDRQIMEECKRRNDENGAYYNEQIEEHKENLDKKDSFIKQFEKKFNEVEIYVQREAGAANDPQWENYQTFEILAFIHNNEMLLRRQNCLLDEVKGINDDMNAILNENVELKKREEYIDLSEDYENEKSKYKTLIKNYKRKIKFMERNNDHLKNVLRSVNRKLENISTYNTDIDHLLKNGKHKKMNSIAAIIFDEQKYKKVDKNRIIEEDNVKNEENEVSERDDENNIEENENESISNNDSEVNPEEDRKDYLEDEMVQNKSIAPEFNINKEQWDISCIENI